jgi:hypothetical protein
MSNDRVDVPGDRPIAMVHDALIHKRDAFA